MIWIAVLLCAISTGLADARWLRVAQREHYLPGSVSRFAFRWWSTELWVAILAVIAVCAIGAAAIVPLDAAFAAGIAAFGPPGLSIRGRTSKFVMTKRARRLTFVTALIQLIITGAGALLGVAAPAAAFVTVCAPFAVDLSLAVCRPYEQRSADGFARKAQKRLQSVAPLEVAITGSFGKTGTKQYVAHLVSGTKAVLATPASFNNLSGLSRTINEQLSPGTQVFVAEMGTYGPGEIKELCDLFPPAISVITAIGPVHLERFGSEDAIVKAKSEIFEHANVAILNVDDSRLAAVAGRLAAAGKKVWRCGSETAETDVRVVISGDTADVRYKGVVIASATNLQAPPTNVACAVAVALEIGVAEADIQSRLSSLPIPEHRQEVSVTADGLTVIDDTFNANPASVRRGLELLASKAPGEHKRVVATPGMVELGKRQVEENRAFAKEVAKSATDMIIIGKTNRKALVEGAAGLGVNTVLVDRLPQAVAWVRQNVGQGDAVLYANDLPDHFP